MSKYDKLYNLNNILHLVAILLLVGSIVAVIGISIIYEFNTTVLISCIGLAITGFILLVVSRFIGMCIDVADHITKK